MSDWSRPDGGPAVGNAALGFVVGQRFERGGKPEYVDIRYQRNGDEREATVLRVTSARQVEDTSSDSVRFWCKPASGETSLREVRIDELLAARPHDNE